MPSSNGNRNLKQLITRIRRNHALEHATIHMLSAHNPKSTIVGRSDSHGFFLYTNLPKLAIEEGAQLALDRLRAGEHRLAIHPNCGTNLLTAGVLSGLAAYFSIQGSGDQNQQDKLKHLPLAIMSAILGLIIAQPLGTRVQQYLTTKAEPGTLEIVSVNRIRSGKGSLYRILTR
ncbi:MAG: hypothetical protein A2Z14_00815 [Chloroflexi bacterium RBG_16_48_8]|nr:MAG: hypothetical protein A2Z14_00815 [Chloroflexi bacterium RBG_16_48_8]